MSSISAPLSSCLAPCRPIAPTLVERLLLRTSRAVEAFAIGRMRRRAAIPVATIDSTADARRTAQALGAIGILPR